jgi:integrase
LRASEIRGLRWSDVDFKKKNLHVRQRADLRGNIGNPKSQDSQRTVPIPSKTLAALREWKPRCPMLDGRQHFVFPNGRGHVEQHQNIVQRGLIPAWENAGVTNRAGEAKYTGLHSLRHFFVSWCLARAPVGQGLSLKEVSELAGHSSIALTGDTYAHLIERPDHSAELASAEGKFG